MHISDFLSEATAYHGSNQDFDSFCVDHIGSGKGYTTFGWGIYLTGHKEIAARYRSRGKGKIYVVSMPDVSDMLDWNKKFREQPAAVQQALMGIGYPELRQQLIDAEEISVGDTTYDSDTGEDIYGTIVTSVLSPYDDRLPYIQEQKKGSMILLKAGIQGIKFYDVESRYDLENFVIFDASKLKIEKTLKEISESVDNITVNYKPVVIYTDC